MNQLQTKELFLESLSRCAHDDEFMSQFYKRFLSSSPDVSHKFANTDFEHQNKMLLCSLRLSAAATAGLPEGLKELRDRAETHDSDHLNIEPRLYDFWQVAIIETAKETDPQWNLETENAWEITLGNIIKHMIKFY